MGFFGVRGTVVTMDEGLGVVRDGVVVVDPSRGVVVDVGPPSLIGDYGLDPVYGGPGRVVMPGLINTHTHSPMSILRGFVSGVSGLKWLRAVWGVESLLKPRHVYVGAVLSIASMIRSGTTAFADHYFYAEEVGRAVVESGVRGVLAKAVVELPEGPPKHDLRDSVAFATTWAGRGGGRVSTMIGIHSLYTCRAETVSEAVEESLSRGVPIHMHLSESRDELVVVRGRYGTTPIKLADRLGVLRVRHLLAHVAYVTDEAELDALGRWGARVAYAPFTKMRGGQVIAPVVEMVGRGASVSLATDGPLSCGDLDMFREMKFMLAAQNLRYGDPSAITPLDALRAATTVAAGNLGLEGVGVLRGGSRADLIVVRAWSPKAVPVTDVYYTLVYSLSGCDVETVIVDGRPLMVNGELLTIDEEAVVREAVKVSEELWGELSRR